MCRRLWTAYVASAAITQMCATVGCVCGKCCNDKYVDNGGLRVGHVLQSQTYVYDSGLRVGQVLQVPCQTVRLHSLTMGCHCNCRLLFLDCNPTFVGGVRCRCYRWLVRRCGCRSQWDPLPPPSSLPWLQSRVCGWRVVQVLQVATETVRLQSLTMGSTADFSSLLEDRSSSPDSSDAIAEEEDDASHL